MSSGQGLVLNGQQAITSTNDDQVSLSDNDFTGPL